MRSWAGKKTDGSPSREGCISSFSKAQEPNPVATSPVLCRLLGTGPATFRTPGKSHCWDFKMLLSGLDCISVLCQACVLAPRELSPQGVRPLSAH